jgi:undecaprenyl pyrophosphate synthase
MVHGSCRPFAHALVLGAELLLEEVQRLQSQVLVDGLDPAAPTEFGLSPRQESPAQLPGPVPAHVAVIMDGNRRWATGHGLPIAEGHRAGLRGVLRLVASALRLGITHLSVYAFSTENWNRSAEELTALFDTAAEGLAQGTQWLHEHGTGWSSRSRLRWRWWRA